MPMLNGAGLFSLSGGLAWHLRAFRHRKGWSQFIAAVNWWLGTWNHGCKGLLLLGPSAGWCLQGSFLAGFQRIHAIDLDPLAPVFFKRLHGPDLGRVGTTLTWERADFFERLDDLLRMYPGHAILFSNVLGQHALHQREPGRAESDLKALATRLLGRQWASFHDRLSGTWPTGRPIPAPFRLEKAEEATVLAARVAGQGEWIDHLTTHVLPDNCKRIVMPWPITPGRLHWIEAGHVA